jgi:hypothetical protein
MLMYNLFNCLITEFTSSWLGCYYNLKERSSSSSVESFYLELGNAINIYRQRDSNSMRQTRETTFNIGPTIEELIVMEVEEWNQVVNERKRKAASDGCSSKDRRGSKRRRCRSV